MSDIVSQKKRTEMMSSVKQKNTKPELLLRKMLHKHGFRFRLHDKKLPGTPDIIMPKYKTVIFVHGCFWHQHKGCRKSRRPTSNVGFWNSKLDKNIERDKTKSEALKKLGWKVLVIWECELKESEILLKNLKKKLLNERD